MIVKQLYNSYRVDIIYLYHLFLNVSNSVNYNELSWYNGWIVWFAFLLFIPCVTNFTLILCVLTMHGFNVPFSSMFERELLGAKLTPPNHSSFFSSHLGQQISNLSCSSNTALVSKTKTIRRKCHYQTPGRRLHRTYTVRKACLISVSKDIYLN